MNKKKHTQGFSTPEGYFNSIEESIFRKIEEEQFPKKQGFEVPDGYFDTIEDRVLHAVSSSEEKTKVISLINTRSIALVLSIAACLAVIITIAVRNNNLTSENLDLATVTDYIDEGYLDLTTYDVSNWIEDDELDEFPLTTLLTEESIEDYLLDHIDEHNLLIE